MFRWSGSSSWAYGVTVRNRGLRGTRMGRPFLLGGLRARVSSWPPLRLVRLRCERVSVCVVPSQRFPSSIDWRERGSGALDRDGRAPRVRAARRGGGRPGARRGPHRRDAGGAAGLGWLAARRRSGGVGGDREQRRDRDAADAAGGPGGGVEPVEDPGHRRGEGEDRQGRRADPGPAAGRGLPAAGVGAGRADPRCCAGW